MVNDHHHGNTIDGNKVVRTDYGPNTGDVHLTTSDGRQWKKLGYCVPNNLPTGTVIKEIK
jgi:hypothetical protein